MPVIRKTNYPARPGVRSAVRSAGGRAAKQSSKSSFDPHFKPVYRCAAGIRKQAEMFTDLFLGNIRPSAPVEKASVDHKVAYDLYRDTSKALVQHSENSRAKMHDQLVVLGISPADYLLTQAFARLYCFVEFAVASLKEKAPDSQKLKVFKELYTRIDTIFKSEARLTRDTVVGYVKEVGQACKIQRNFLSQVFHCLFGFATRSSKALNKVLSEIKQDMRVQPQLGIVFFNELQREPSEKAPELVQNPLFTGTSTSTLDTPGASV